MQVQLAALHPLTYPGKGFQIIQRNLYDSLLTGALAGLGLGIVSVHTVALEMEVKRLAVLDVASMPIIRHWYLVHRKDKRLSPVVQAFKDFYFARGQRYDRVAD